MELTCRVYNINQGRNKMLLEKCPVLREYMIFVDYVREYHKEEGYNNLETAINRAIDRCIEEGILRDFLIENRSEVVKVTQLDYTFDRQIELEREDARLEGRAEGLAEGREEGRAEVVKNMLFHGVPEEDIRNFVGCEQNFIEEIKRQSSVKNI